MFLLSYHTAAEDLALCLEHLTHAAFAEFIGELVLPERLADHEEASSKSTAGAMQ
jgi:hypothetical protein